LKDEKLIKEQTYMKLKHTNSILAYFEYFSQISSKSILICLSYIGPSVLKLTLFLRHSV